MTHRDVSPEDDGGHVVLVDEGQLPLQLLGQQVVDRGRLAVPGLHLHTRKRTLGQCLHVLSGPDFFFKNTVL